MTYTPDSLRAAADSNQTDSYGRWQMRAHADAWDRQANSLVGRLADIAEDNAALRKRLEAAETTLAMLSIERDVMLADTPLSTQKVNVTFRLAGEEKP